MGNKGKIKSIERSIPWAHFVHGTNYSKGDYLHTIVMFIVRVIGEVTFEVDRDTLLMQDPGRTRIT